VSASGTVHIHLFSGLLSHFSLFRAGGGGGRGRRGGGLLKRLARSAAKTFGEATGSGSAGRGRPAGGRPDAASFERFKASREDLFEDQGDELVDDQDDEDIVDAELVDDDEDEDAYGGRRAIGPGGAS
jgi:hypothetical protein